MRAIACFLLLLLGIGVAFGGIMAGVFLDVSVGDGPSLMGFLIGLVSLGAGLVIMQKAEDVW